MSRSLVGNKLVGHSDDYSMSIACQCCSSNIFILVLTPGFNGFGKEKLQQDETRNISILEFDAPYTYTIYINELGHNWFK